MRAAARYRYGSHGDDPDIVVVRPASSSRGSESAALQAQGAAGMSRVLAGWKSAASTPPIAPSRARGRREEALTPNWPRPDEEDHGRISKSRKRWDDFGIYIGDGKQLF